ncbi:MAG: hypothetical protein KKD05_11815 [Candidatus Omnitrophica bacterium]|nr:hypothetical protein [Candidatus Omnitrophota bacterium]
MAPKIKQFLQKIKQVNKEYLLLFAIVTLIGLLIYSSTATSQQSPEEITLTTFYPCPFGEYDRITASRFIDFDNVNRWFDPSGDTQLESLRVFNGILANVVVGPAGTYSVNFVTGEAFLNVVTADKLVMTGPAPSPTYEVNGGNYVWDIAEGMLITECTAGDVVIIGDDPGKGLVKSTEKFDSRVAGIVSTDPKIYMGAAEDKMPLALAGIVKCNATVENGAIKRGDLLVSSSLPGYAMRASAKEVKPGMLVGKALQELTSGQDKIFVLVNKQ